MRRVCGGVLAAAAGVALMSCERSPSAVERADAAGSAGTPEKAAAVIPSDAGLPETPASSGAARALEPSGAASPASGGFRLTPPVRSDTLAKVDPAEAAMPPSPAAPATPPLPTPGTRASGQVAPQSYPPKNECSALPNYPAFRAKLAASVRNRDAESLAALAAPDVKLDFGGGAGRDQLRARLSGRPGLWRELADILQLGCAADGDLATMPWIFSRMPESADPYRAMLVLGEKVALRERPAVDAPVRSELSWALVAPVAGGRDPKQRFVEVEAAGGTLRGFIDTASLRSLLGYRLVAEPQAGGWAITAFIAGD